MSSFKIDFISVLMDFIQEHGVEGAFDELFPDREPAEVFYDMYEAGLIPDYNMEKFLGE